jgi:CrcB protein
MLNMFSVFIGGGLGSLLRYLVNITLGKSALCEACIIPLATLLVNIAGSFIIGFAYAVIIQKTGFPPYLKLALTTGFCGGLTTFSAFSMETYDLLSQGELYAAAGYIILSVTICIIFAASGIYTGTTLGAYLAK